MNQIAVARQRRKLEQGAAAALTNLTLERLAEIEEGSEPTRAELLSLTCVLHVAPSELLGLALPPPPIHPVSADARPFRIEDY